MNVFALVVIIYVFKMIEVKLYLKDKKELEALREIVKSYLKSYEKDFNPFLTEVELNAIVKLDVALKEVKV